MPDCIFCKIAKGEIPAAKLWEDEKFLAFLDIRPIQTGHVLLIPKEHFEDAYEISDPLYGELFETAKDLAKRLKKATGAKRIGLVIEGFGVDHVHVHLVPVNGPHELNPLLAHEISKEELATTRQKLESYFKG